MQSVVVAKRSCATTLVALCSYRGFQMGEACNVSGLARSVVVGTNPDE